MLPEASRPKAGQIGLAFLWQKLFLSFIRLRQNRLRTSTLIYTQKKNIFRWYKSVLRLVLAQWDIYNKSRLYNIDKKGARLSCFAKEYVIVLIYIKEIYTRVSENRKSLTVIKFITVNKTAILLVIIVLR
jgi:hypothetical protein